MTMKPINKKQLHNKIIILKKKFSTNEIINSTLKIFVEQNSIDFNNLNKLNECKYYFNYNNIELYKKMKAEFLIISLKDLEAIFESLIDIDRKKAEGVVYTPDYIIDYIINYSLSIYKGENIPIFCDPSCGSGGFLIRAISILSSKYDISIKDTLQYIKGIDINSQAVSYTKIVIEIYFLQNNILISSLDSNIICSDTLISSKKDLFKKLNIKNGIDILATNPPYVKLQNISLEYRKELIEKYTIFTKGNFSFSMLFLIAGKNLLSDKGILGFITQNNFFTSLSAKNIRAFLQEEKCIHTIIDFVHTKIFENASAYTCLMFLTNGEKIEKLNFKWALNPILDLNNNYNFSQILVNKLNSKKWRLAPKIHLENIDKIENIGSKLIDITDIKVGFATLKDSVFLLDRNSKLDIEEEITVPALKISELADEESINIKQRKIIFPYKKVNNKFVAYEEIEFKKKFPKVYKYLLANRNILEKRSQGKNKLKNFYEWGRMQGMDSQSYKLLTKTFAGKPNFILDKTSSIFCNGYSVKPKKLTNNLFQTQTIDILILQKILNSAVMDYYTKLTSFQIEGNYQCFQKNFIELFNIPNLSKEDIKFINNNCGKKLDKYLCKLYEINYEDILDIINR